MGNTALVLGGGGVLGISWLTGILNGLAEKGIDVTGSDIIIGTSAGSVVGTQLALGRTLDELMDAQSRPPEDALEDNLVVDLPYLMTVFAKWSSFREMTDEACAEVGAMAVAAKTMTLEQWLQTFGEIAGEDWPERPLKVTAVDADTGAFRAWDRGAAVPLASAVASSCTVPGLFPVVPINGNRYMDGGVRSTTNADLAAGYERILILAPIGARQDGIDPLGRRISEAEIAALTAAGAHADLIFPDANSLEAIGINRMDSTRRHPTAIAGARQGEALAEQLAPAWSEAAV